MTTTEVKFKKYEPHAFSGGYGILCVVPSGFKTIGWFARLEYSVKGTFPTGQAKNGKLYVKVVQDREDTLTYHNNSQSKNNWRVIEYFPVTTSGVCSYDDDHGVKFNWRPITSGVCEIKSKTSLALSLLVLPNANGTAFGTPKFKPDNESDPEKGTPVKSQGSVGKGSFQVTDAMTQGGYEPTGYKGKKWRTEYEMNPAHCLKNLVAEPPPPPIPTIKTETAALNVADRSRNVASGGSAMASVPVRSTTVLGGVVPTATGPSRIVGALQPANSQDGLVFHRGPAGGVAIEGGAD